jgi:hypothetical protein
MTSQVEDAVCWVASITERGEDVASSIANIPPSIASIPPASANIPPSIVNEI